jgi:hypothetical protein
LASDARSDTSTIPLPQDGDHDVVGITGRHMESDHTVRIGPSNHPRYITEVPNDITRLPVMGGHTQGGSLWTQEDPNERESSVHKTNLSGLKTKHLLPPYDVPQNRVIKFNFASTEVRSPSASNVSTTIAAIGSESSGFNLFNGIDSKQSSGRSMSPVDARLEDPLTVNSNSRTGFDAALDEAVDAAYDESYEPIDSAAPGVDAETVESDIEVQTSLREARLANQQLRDAGGRDKHTSALGLVLRQTQVTAEPPCRDFYNDDSSEDGDRATEVGIAHHDGILRNDGHATSEFTDDETRTTAILPELQITKSFGLDSPSNVETASESLETSSPGNPSTVWSRRLSGQHIKQLKIETSAKFGTPNQIVFTDTECVNPNPGNDLNDSRNNLVFGTKGQDHVPLLSPRSATHDIVDPVHQDTQASKSSNHDSASSYLDSSCQLPQRPVLRKEFSSSSLRSIRIRKMSIGVQDDPDLSPGTPAANPFIGSLNDSTSGVLPYDGHTPTSFSLGGRSDSGLHSGTSRAFNSHVSGTLHILDDNLHAINTPGSPNASVPGAPAPLEACPTETPLRPFWLMRCIYQTLAHPCGGYISTRLFVPRDAWKVKGVKLKNVEDKIASCDLLTAALLKLARVDPNDADAVLEEMQSFELVLDHVQTNLIRRLGNEVGPHASGLVGPVASESDHSAAMPRSSSVSSKSSSFSWKRLRSKNSAAGLGSNHAAPRPIGPDAISDVLAPATLPMSSNVSCRPPKREFHQVQFSGPNASYMTSLAQLFDAAQAIDIIARQVDDPGLRHADKTQVGLELSTRRAAEFFGFYICRFVLSDMALLLDKFIKRGSEWVLV